ncbi:MAG: RnfABCDGE type electron transport complex subunit G [Ignavibacterium sp.]
MKKIVHIILTLTLIGIVAGAILSRVDNWSKPLIAANQKAETERAIFLVNPSGKIYEEIKNIDCEVYKVFDINHNLIAYSFVYNGNGFQGNIKMMIGVKPDLNNITAIEILEQSETPGLGTKVTEEPFKNQFKNLNNSPSITWVKGKKPSEPNQIEAITGATISSKSVVAIVNNGIAKLRDLRHEGKI